MENCLPTLFYLYISIYIYYLSSPKSIKLHVNRGFLSVLFNSLSAVPRTVPGIQQMLNKYFLDKLMNG